MTKHKFPKGNNYGNRSGRIPNMFSKKYLIEHNLTPEEFNALFFLLKQKAAGADIPIDVQAIKIIMEIVPIKRTYIDADHIKDLSTEEKVDKAVEKTLNQVGEGILSIEDALQVVALIEKRGMIMLKKEINEFERRKILEEETE